METQSTERRIAIMNVSVLDLRRASAESLAQVSHLTNVGKVLCTGDPSKLLAGRVMLNVGKVVSVPLDATFTKISGPMTVARDFFKGRDKPTGLIVSGPLDFDPDVPAEEIEKGLGPLIVSGPLTCPEHLRNAIQPNICSVSGPVRSYHCPPSVPFVRGTVALDEDYLDALEDSSEFAVLGRLRLPDVISNDLLTKKLRKLYVTGSIECHAENLQALQGCLVDKSKRIKVIPTGYTLVEGPLVLDEAALESLPGPKLYCTGRVEVSPDTAPATLDQNLKGLIGEDMVFCPAALKEAMASKGDWFATRLVVYEGVLWIVDDERQLAPHHFELLEGKATLVVFGELQIDQAVAPQTLSDRLDKVHNLGAIWCTPEQMEVLRTLIGLRDGELLDATSEEASDQEPPGGGESPVNLNYTEMIGNSSYLVL
jgi:hypothetical protein